MCTAIALLFVVSFVGIFGFLNGFQTVYDSQTREAKPHVLPDTGGSRSLTSVTGLVLANKLSYTSGTSTIADYSATWASDDTYHVSTSSSYSGSEYDYANPTSNPTYTYGTLTSGGIWQTYTINSSYQVSTSAVYTVSSGSQTNKFPTGGATAGVRTPVWNTPTNIYAEDGSYAYTTVLAGGLSDRLVGYGYGFTIPAGNTIDGIYFEQKKMVQTAPSLCDYEVFLQRPDGTLSSNYATSTEYSSSMTWYGYGGSSNLWGISWTVGDINTGGSSGFRGLLSCQPKTQGGQARVDCYRMSVWYHLNNYRADYYYSFIFATDVPAVVTALNYSATGKGSLTGVKIYIGNYAGGSSVTWVDTTKTFTTSDTTQSGTGVPTSYMGSSGQLAIRFQLDGQSSSFTVSIDQVKWGVAYSGYRINYYYELQANVLKSSITGITWSAEGKTNTSSVKLYLYNFTYPSSWYDTTQTWTSTEATKTGTISPGDFMDSSSSLRIRICQSGMTSGFTVSADYVKLEIRYNYGASSTEYPKANAPPTVINGTLVSGTYTSTWVSDNSYHVYSGIYDHSGSTQNILKYPSYAEQDSSVGTQPWSDVNNVKADDYTYASCAGGVGYYYSYYLKASHFGFSISDDATINGIMMELKRGKNDAAGTGVYDYHVYLMKSNSTVGANNAKEGNWPNIPAVYTTYGWSNYLWGTTWTPGEINGNGFGVALSIELWSILYTVYGYVDCFRITVYYYFKYYDVDFYYPFQAVNSSYTKVSGLMWTVEGSTSSPSVGIYLFDYGLSSWHDTGESLGASESTKSQIVDKTHFMASNGSMFIRFYADNAPSPSPFNISIDYMKWDVTIQAKPTISYPENDTVIGTNTPVFRWGQVLAVSPITYNLQASSVGNFSSLILNTTTTETYYMVTSGMTGGIKYCRVRSIDGLNMISDWSDTIYFIINNIAPSAPVLLSPSNGTYTDAYTIPFAWQNASSEYDTISYYQIEISDVSAAFPSALFLNETTYSTSYLLAFSNEIPYKWYYWRVRGVDILGNIGYWSDVWMFYPDISLSILYYDLDYWGVPFEKVQTYINGTQYTASPVILPSVYGHANITTTDFFDTVIAQRTYQINASTTQCIKIALQLVSVTLKAYDLTMCNITYGSQPIKTLSFYDSATILLKPGTYSFTGTALKGAVSFNLPDQVISITLNRVIQLCSVSATAYVKYENQNDPNHNSLPPTNFNTKYYVPSQGQWIWLSPYIPQLTMLTSEKVNFTVYDNLGSTVINNEQYSYNQTISVLIDVFMVKVKAYGENTFGTVSFHRNSTTSGGAQPVLGANDILIYYLYPGLYRLDIHWNFIMTGTGQIIQLDSWLNRTYWINSTGYPQYVAAFLVPCANASDIIDVLNHEGDTLVDIRLQLHPGGEVYDNTQAAATGIQDLGNKADTITTNQQIALFFIFVAIAVPGVIMYIGDRERNRITKRYGRRLQTS